MMLPPRTISLYLLAALLFAYAPFVYASSTVGTIDSTYKYAWGSVAGWVNCAPTSGGLTVTDSGISGYAWAESTGWINFNPTHSGVTNDGNGTLSGYAWDETGGWVSFAGVTIDTSGKFHGQATGGMVDGEPYIINFSCTNCDVRTDWRPISVRTTNPDTVTTSTSGGNGPPWLIPPAYNPSAAVVLPEPTTLPDDHPAVITGGAAYRPPQRPSTQPTPTARPLASNSRTSGISATSAFDVMSATRTTSTASVDTQRAPSKTAPRINEKKVASTTSATSTSIASFARAAVVPIGGLIILIILAFVALRFL